MEACSCHSGYVWPLKRMRFVIGLRGRILCLKREHKASSGSYSGKEKRGRDSHLGYLEFSRGHLAIPFWP